MAFGNSTVLSLGVLVLAACGSAPIESGAVTSAITASIPDDGDPSVVALIGDAGVFCSGSLIGTRVVLTAAHCLSSVTPQTQVFFGADPAVDGTALHVRDARPHPGFDLVEFDNDVALLLLDGEAPAAAQPLELFAGPMDASYVGRAIRLVGFGRQSAADTTPLRKREGTSAIKQVYAGDFTYDATPSQTCEGDSGGPAFVDESGRELLAGVTSNGTADCMQGADDARVDVHIADFIAPYLAATAPGVAGAGERCFYDQNCTTGSCRFPADAPSIGYCTVACPADGGCPQGMSCGDDGLCAYPPPSPGAPGTPCATASDCDNRDCAVAETRDQATCAITCYPNAIACPAGMDCLVLAGHPAHYGCFPAAAGGCAVAGGASGSGLALLGVLGLLGAARRAYRRRTTTDCVGDQDAAADHD